MTWAELISRVRVATDDKVLAARRCTDEELLQMATDGIREIWRMSPASRYGDDIRLRSQPLSEPTATSAPIPLADRWLAALFHYVCHRVFGLDTSEASNREASTQHFSRFQAAAI